MHELSLCEGIVSAVERTAERYGVAKIKSVRVAVGRLAGVDIPSLEFAWRSVTMTGPLTGAKLVIERPEGTAFCTDCGECSRVCPQGIPLHLFNRKFIKDIDEFYGEYQAGADTESRAPLTDFTFEDVEPGIVSERGGGR